jgi:two-component system NtrC family response regulator
MTVRERYGQNLAALDKLLIVDDEEAILKQLKWAFKNDYEIITASSADEAVSAVREHSPAVMILDLSLTDDASELEGFEVLETALGIDPRIKVVMITGHDDMENALKSIETGAADFYAKPVDVEELKIILRRAFHISSLEEEIDRLKERYSPGHEFEGVMGMSEPMLGIFEAVRRIAPTGVSVLITGESGTGKELIARAIHNQSACSGGPFVPINCGAIPENLIESELFGHEKGSFTGAHATKTGKFEAADGGTLFLDEIGELPLSLQVKLLRFLQDQIVERVGGGEPIQVDARVIAATNRDLEEMIEEKAFREDLFYRIDTVRISMPPLRDRGNDILLLATRFLRQYSSEFSRGMKGYSRAAIEAIHSYRWPGNVRELDNRVKRGVIMAASNLIQPSDLDIPFDGDTEGETAGEPASLDVTGEMTLKEAREKLEKRMVVAALLRTSGNISAAAGELNVSRPTLHDLLKKHDIDAGDFRAPKDKK